MLAVGIPVLKSIMLIIDNSGIKAGKRHDIRKRWLGNEL